MLVRSLSDGLQTLHDVLQVDAAHLPRLARLIGWDPNLTLRAGVAYEKSPIDDSNRQITLPDADRFWTSVGASYKLSNKLSLDLAYSHIFPKSGTITSTMTSPPIAFYGTMKAQVDIVSVGLEYRWDTPAAPATIAAKY